MEPLNKKIFRIIEEKFGLYPDWNLVEPDILLFTSKLPISNNPTFKQDVISIIGQIKEFLKKNLNLRKTKLDFLDKELEFLNNIEQRIVHNTQVNSVTEEDVRLMQEFTYDTEGVINIKKNYNFEQLKVLSKKIHKKTKLCKFFISNKDIIRGKIISEQYDYFTTIPLITEVYNKPEERKELIIFPDKISKFQILKEIQVPFFIYRFLSIDNKEMMLFSVEKLEVGDVTIQGVMTNVPDKRVFGETVKLSTVLPILFVQSTQYRTPKFKDLEEFSNWWAKTKDNEGKWFETPFIVYNERKDKHFLYEYHDWFKDFVWLFHLHAPLGVKNLYPMHFMIVGPQGTGKSDLMDNLHSLSQETQAVFSGSSSTMKNLVPSFKEKPAQMGYLARSNRFAYCDEFFRVILRNQGAIKEEGVGETFGVMNDLLQHQKRDIGSGTSRINIKMTAKMLGATNPVMNTTDMKSLLEKIDNAFLSRIVFYFQQPEDIQLVQRKGSSLSNLKQMKPKLDSFEWLAIMDFMSGIFSKVDDKKIDEIYEKFIDIVPANVVRHYESRQKHHLECIADGYIKLQYLKGELTELVGTEDTYDDIEMIWRKIVFSWFDSGDMGQLKSKEKLRILPRYIRNLFNYIKEKKPTYQEIKEINLEARKNPKINEKKNIEATIILVDNGLVSFDEGTERYKTYLNE